MLNTIKTFFEEHIAPGRSDSQQDEEHRLQVAVAALLAEVVRMDEQMAEGERAQVLASIAEKFGLDAEEAEALPTRRAPGRQVIVRTAHATLGTLYGQLILR